MKKTYLKPELRDRDLWLEKNFLISAGGSTGENLDDPEDFNPWS